MSIYADEHSAQFLNALATELGLTPCKVTGEAIVRAAFNRIRDHKKAEVTEDDREVNDACIDLGVALGRNPFGQKRSDIIRDGVTRIGSLQSELLETHKRLERAEPSSVRSAIGQLRDLLKCGDGPNEHQVVHLAIKEIERLRVVAQNEHDAKVRALDEASGNNRDAMVAEEVLEYAKSKWAEELGRYVAEEASARRERIESVIGAFEDGYRARLAQDSPEEIE
jgi:hypothetical protein